MNRKKTNIVVHTLFLAGTLTSLLFTQVSLTFAAEAIEQEKSLTLNEQGTKAAQAGRIEQAKELFRKAIVTDPGNLTAVFNLAGMYITLRRETEAVSLLQDYITKYPKDVGLHARLGDAYFANKQVSEAHESYQTALELDGENVELLQKQATILSLQNRLGEAEALLLKAAEIDPKNADTLSNLSSIFLANRKPEKAISTAKRALQIEPSGDLYVTLGTAYEYLKDYKNSLIAFERAQSLSEEEQTDIAQKIEALRKQQEKS